MCDCVIYDGKSYCTQEELEIICPEGLVYRDPDTPHDKTCCLCPVHLVKTAEKNGYKSKSGDFDVFYTRD